MLFCEVRESLTHFHFQLYVFLAHAVFVQQKVKPKTQFGTSQRGGKAQTWLLWISHSLCKCPNESYTTYNTENGHTVVRIWIISVANFSAQSQPEPNLAHAKGGEKVHACVFWTLHLITHIIMSHMQLATQQTELPMSSWKFPNCDAVLTQGQTRTRFGTCQRRGEGSSFSVLEFGHQSAPQNNLYATYNAANGCTVAEKKRYHYGRKLPAFHIPAKHKKSNPHPNGHSAPQEGRRFTLSCCFVMFERVWHTFIFHFSFLDSTTFLLPHTKLDQQHHHNGAPGWKSCLQLSATCKREYTHCKWQKLVHA